MNNNPPFLTFNDDGGGRRHSFSVWCEGMPGETVPDGYGRTLDEARANYIENLAVWLTGARRGIAIAETINNETPSRSVQETYE